MRVKILSVLAALLLLVACGDRETNPIGQDLVGRDEGDLVVLSDLPAAGHEVLFDGVYPATGGLEYELLVGRMSGLRLRALLRFRFPADSLARAAGGAGAADLVVNTASVRLRRKPDMDRLSGALEVAQPAFEWDEQTAFADTVDFVALEVPSTPLPGAAVAAEGDTAYTVVLPPDYVAAAASADPDSGRIEILLAPVAGETFLTALVSRNELTAEYAGQRPTLSVSYTVAGVDREYRAVSSADAYWPDRTDAGVPSDALVMCSVVRLIPRLWFQLPDDIPDGATVVSTKLKVTIDEDRSFYTQFPFGVDRIDVSSATGDTVETRYNTWYFEDAADSFTLGQGLVQGWLAGEVPNAGVLLKPRIITLLEWVTFRNPRLEVIYAEPPRSDSE